MHACAAIGFSNLLCIGIDADQAFGVDDLGAQSYQAVFVGGQGDALGGFGRVGCVCGVSHGLCAVGIYKAGVAGFNGEDDGDVGQQVVGVVDHAVRDVAFNQT